MPIDAPPTSNQGSPFQFSLRALLIGVATICVVLGLAMTQVRTLVLAGNTLLLALGTCGLALPIGTLLAVLLWRTDVPGRRGALALIAAMLFVPIYLQAAAWDAGFGLQGWFSVQQGNLQFPPLMGWRAVIWVHALAAVPWVVLIVGVGLRLVEPELEELALLDMSPWQVVCRVTLPRAWPAIAAAGLWILVTLAGEIAVTDLYRVRTYAEEVYTGFALGDEPEQAALGVLPGMAVVASLVVAALVLAVALAPPARLASPRRSLRFNLGLWRWPAAALVLIALLLLAGVPLADLCYQAGIKVTLSGDERVREWSPEKLVRIVWQSPREFGRELVWTNAIGVFAASLSAAVAAPLAWLARKGGTRAWPAIAVIAVCLAVPGPLIGLGVVNLFHLVNADWVEYLYSRTILAPALAVSIRALPVTLLVYWYGLASVSPELLESAEVDGAGPLSRFFRIVLPLRWGAILVGWLAALAVATGDLAASILSVPPGVSLLSIRIFEMVHFGVTDRLAGICLVSTGTFVLLAALSVLVWREKEV